MVSTSIISPTAAPQASEGTNQPENKGSHTDMQATNEQVRAAFALARRERDAVLRVSPTTIQHIRELIALECTRVDCPGRSHPLCCWNWDDRTPLACARGGKSVTCPDRGSSNAEEDESGTLTCPDCGVSIAFPVGGAA